MCSAKVVGAQFGHSESATTGAVVGQSGSELAVKAVIGLGLLLGVGGVAGLVGGSAHLFQATQISQCHILPALPPAPGSARPQCRASWCGGAEPAVADSATAHACTRLYACFEPNMCTKARVFATQ